ncbi:MAG: HNH endonuclease [Lachnospiraceae bacterium]|nr:HNH endonuclease [Lachnospiraceae bacterium]
MVGEHFFLSFEEKQKRTPKNHGHWTGERGNSVFYSDRDEVKKIGAECVRYINGEPDFTEYSKYVFEIDSMTDDRLPYPGDYESNFEQAYRKLAEILSMNKAEAKRWLKNEHYSIHESNDLKTIYIVPTSIHKTYIHAGGVAECRWFLRDEEDDRMIESIY